MPTCLNDKTVLEVHQPINWTAGFISPLDHRAALEHVFLMPVNPSRFSKRWKSNFFACQNLVPTSSQLHYFATVKTHFYQIAWSSRTALHLPKLHLGIKLWIYFCKQKQCFPITPHSPKWLTLKKESKSLPRKWKPLAAFHTTFSLQGLRNTGYSLWGLYATWVSLWGLT